MKKEDGKMNEAVRNIFIEMFKYVGVEFTDEFVKQDGWYKLYSWTEKDEYKFRRWLLEYMKEHRKELFGRRVSVTSIKHEIPWFMLSYSWTHKKDLPDTKTTHTESTFGKDPNAWTHLSEVGRWDREK